MAGEAAKRDLRTWFICHRQELITQTHLTFQKYGIRHGIVGAGAQIETDATVQVCSIDTLKNRLHLLPKPRQILWDECHHLGAEGWRSVQEAVPDAYNIGFSATPCRTDGTGLEIGFDELVEGPQSGWLIDQGFLSEFRYFAPPLPKRPPKGEAPQLVGDVVSHWWKRARGLRTVGFAKNRAHSQAMAAAFNAAGIASAHIDGTTSDDERVRIIRDFALGKITVLWNVALIGEGFDLAAIAQMDVTIDCVILNRRTMSLSLFLQWVGRALRPAPGKMAVILDHGGNAAIHGYPDDEREWTLQGIKKPAAGADNDNGPRPPVNCPECWNQFRLKAGQAMPERCPHCDELLPVPKVKEIKVAEGELEEGRTPQERKAKRWELAREQAACETLGALVRLGQQRGHKSPQQWAFKIWSARKAKERAAA